MAGSKLIYSYKVQASTLLEVLISMVVIVAVFGIAMMIYLNVVRSSPSVKKIQAQALLNEARQSAVSSQENLMDNSFTVGDFRIEQTVKNYQDDKNLVEIDMAAYDISQQKVAESHAVMINKNE
jgi:Tfp pilus assembly protein PilV